MGCNRCQGKVASTAISDGDRLALVAKVTYSTTTNSDIESVCRGVFKNTCQDCHNQLVVCTVSIALLRSRCYDRAPL